MAELDFYDVADKIYRLISSRKSTVESLQSYFKFCERHFPAPLWQRLIKSDLEGDLSKLVTWLDGVLTAEPPKRITAFWFGMFNPYVNQKVSCGLYVAGSLKYRKDINDDIDAFVGPAYFPERRYAESHVLAEIYRLTSRSKMAKCDAAEEFGCLGFSAISVSHLMRTVNQRLLLGKARERGVVVGFDSGDCLKIGTIDYRHGFIPHHTERPTLSVAVPTASSSEFYQIVNATQGRWWLEEPRENTGDDLPISFWTTGKPLDLKLPLKTVVMSTPKGDPADFTFAVLDTPIVTEAVGRLLSEAAPGTVQRLPVRITGKRGRYEVLNPLVVVDCVDLKRSRIIPFGSQSAKNPTDKEPSLGSIMKLVIDNRRARGHEFFMLAGDRSTILVSRRIKELLEANRVSGVCLKPV
jgi:hypothetical protein